MSYNSLNRLELTEQIEKPESEFFAFSKHIKEKYGLNNDILRILDLISFEEMLALKLEKSLNVFNGKYTLPMKHIYYLWINKAMALVMSEYDNGSKLKKKVRLLLSFTLRQRFSFYKKYAKNIRYYKYKEPLPEPIKKIKSKGKT